MKVESKQLESSVTLSGESLPTQDDRHVKQEGLLPQGPRKYWEISAHCNTVRLPQSKPDISFDNPSSNYHYQLLTSAPPNRQEAKLITQLQGLARLNRSKLQVRNFVFPVQLMKMKHMDPQSRHKIIEELCKYFSLQRGLYNIVLEQAELKFQDLCCLLVAIAGSCRVKSLYLWHVLNTCEKPFKGPLQSDIVLDDLPRVPYTYNPGGRKYLRELGKAKVHKLEREISKETKKVVISDESLTKKSDLKVPSYTNKSGESSYNLRVQQSPNVDSHDFMVRTHSRVDSNNLFTQHQKEGMKNKSTSNRSVSYADQNTFSQTESYNSQTTGLYSDNILKQNVNENKSVNNSLKLNQSISFAQQSPSQQESYHSQSTKFNMVKFSTQHYIVEHLLKRILTQTSGEIPFDLMEKELVHSVSSVYEDHVFSQADAGVQCQMSLNSKETVSLDATSAHDSTTNESHLNAGKTPLLGFCKSYLKFYENTEIDVDVLRDMYMISLNNLTHLTQLAINYSLLADGTGDALLSVGSIAKGRLKHLKLLCEPEDIPSPTHQLYEAKALQAIPDLVWHYVREKCPDLEVHIVCVSMSAYDVTKRFVTRSMPLSSFCMENGFCPTSAVPELTIFCTLKCLWLDHAETLEHVNLTLWHSTGRIDSSLVELLKRTRLSSFAYHGPLQKKKSVNEMCDAALNSSKMKSFKLMIQGDPCFPSNAKQASSHIYNQYIHRFQDKSIEFTLGTFS